MICNIMKVKKRNKSFIICRKCNKNYNNKLKYGNHESQMLEIFKPIIHMTKSSTLKVFWDNHQTQENRLGTFLSKRH